MNLHVLIEGDEGQIELTDFTVKRFDKQRRPSSETLAYPHLNKPYIILEGRIDLNTDSAEKPDALKFVKWALLPADNKNAYKKVTVSRYIIERLDEQIVFERGFILNYEEHFVDTVGTKDFKIILADAAEFIE